jgi:hypothetical protein
VATVISSNNFDNIPVTFYIKMASIYIKKKEKEKEKEKKRRRRRRLNHATHL